MTFFSWKARCVLGLLLALSVTSKEDLCIVRMSGGKMRRFGNCQEIDKSSVLEDLRLKAQACLATITDGCYWTEYLKSGRNVSEAESVCATYGGVLAIIPDRKTYDEIAKDARQKLLDNNDRPYGRGFWLGMTYDTATKTVHPEGAFDGIWYSGRPNPNPVFTGLELVVRLGSGYQGLWNVHPNGTQRGAVCSKPTTTT